MSWRLRSLIEFWRRSGRTHCLEIGYFKKKFHEYSRLLKIQLNTIASPYNNSLQNSTWQNSGLQVAFFERVEDLLLESIQPY